MITAHPDAPEGSVTRLKDYIPEDFKPTSAILCRLTAPLVSFAFSLIRRQVGCRILGREIGQGLVALVKKMGGHSIEELESRLSTYLQRETSKFEAKGELASADAVRDRCECIQVFINSLEERFASDPTPELCRRIQALFSDDESKLLTLSTVHKAKGLEWPDVFILDFSKLMPSKFATRPWQIDQEWNLIYVAQTRAKLNLYYIDSNAWRIKSQVTVKPSLVQQLTDAD